MFNLKLYILALLVILCADLPWIYFIMSKEYSKFASTSPNFEFILRPTPALIAYLLLALPFATFLSDHNVFNAVICGLCIYGVFAFTNYAIFADWPLKLVLLDTLWGSLLFLITNRIICAVNHLIDL